jgi:glycerophosphoryl diester phosphodiesterase
MKKAFLLIVLAFTLNAFSQIPANFSIEGHRGARGYVPENTIPSFIKGLELGADTVELDVVISKDGKVVVSHDTYFSSVISSDKTGQPITAEKQKDYVLYKMNYDEIKLYDVGIRGNKDFSEQVKMKVYKPLLSDVFVEVGKYAKKNKIKNLRYNIEIKSAPEGDGVNHPAPAEFAKLVYDVILKYKMQNNVIVQSFDVRPLQELRKMPVKLPLSFLVGNKDGVEKNFEKLGFSPDTYSPHYGLVDEATVNYVHAKGVKIVPWTVNETADLEKMKTFKLDGIITDYPDRAVKVFKK